MHEQPELKVIPIYDDGNPVDAQPAPVLRVRWYHYVQAWFWNLMRRPKVRAKQRELLKIAEGIQARLKVEVLPHLWQVRMVCPTCRENYGALRSEVFVSTIKMMLTKMKCEDHPEPYVQFLDHCALDFKRNEEVAAWINGFN